MLYPLFIGSLIAIAALMALYVFREPLGRLLGLSQRRVSEGIKEAQRAYKEGLEEEE